MNQLIKFYRVLMITISVCFAAIGTANAQDVDARLSTREAYVGMPVVLQIAIRNAADYQAPTVPEIDGCDIRSAGAPSQSSQITIINGRRSESRSVTMQYLITPRRPGKFEIPPMTVNVDGRNLKTKRLTFVATKSETGDLLFAEIEGGKETVFVGEPLDLTLKIWVKPFRDRENRITLSEANMWQMVSKQTSWGSFVDRLREMAKKNQRPGGAEVLRDDGQGNERSYYLYEIKATVYPTRPGKINADDVQIIVNYPTALGKSRDPFDDLFKDSPFGGRMNRLMDDDFFSSPFSHRLSVKSTRPVVAEAKVDSTKVLPVPVAGRPVDYRGAVGKYNIVTRAAPNSVSAGDPITLNIGIVGDGPMELVQAPPLSELPSLTADFKVTDQSLAGFVQNETKVFSTAIRPRREGISEIPAIPFSFFDPETESFKTVYSEPISITVNKAETLSLDSIVGKSKSGKQGIDDSDSSAEPVRPDLTNHTSDSILISQTQTVFLQWWWVFIGVPPLVWLFTVFLCNRGFILARMPNIKSAQSSCLANIEQATDCKEITQAIVQYISRRFGKPCFDSRTGIGVLRTSGLRSTANEIESFFSKCERETIGVTTEESFSDAQRVAKSFVGQVENDFATLKKRQVKRSAQNGGRRSGNMKSKRLGRSRTPGRTVVLLMAASTFWAVEANAVEANGSGSPPPTNVLEGDVRQGATRDAVQLGDSQRQTILKEANELYREAQSNVETDSAEANDGFSAAAAKYQMLVDSGVSNSKLFVNLGNSYLQSGELGRAIANYERALRIAPTDRQIQANLDFAKSQVERPETDMSSVNFDDNSLSWGSVLRRIRSTNDSINSLIGMSTMIGMLAISSILFWGILITRTLGNRIPVWRLAVLPMLIMTFSIVSILLSKTNTDTGAQGIVVTNELTLHAGDGTQFATVHSIESTQGQPIRILSERAKWVQVETAQGQTGWVESSFIEKILP